MTLPAVSNCRAPSLFEDVFNVIQDGIVILDDELNITLANQWVEHRWLPELPLVGKKCYEVFRADQAPCPECPFVRCFDTGAPQRQILRCLSDHDLTEWFEMLVYPLEDVDGEATRAIGHIRNVTEYKSAEESLKNELSRRRTMVEQSRDGIVVLDETGKVFEANQEFARMLGYSMEELYQVRVWDWNTQFGKEQLLERLRTIDTRGDHFETRHRRKDGTLCEVEISSNGAEYGGQKLVFCVCRDVTEKKAMKEQIRELAIRDPLTNVYNRRHIFERLAEIIAEYSRGGRDFCVSILDIDHFKAVNDTHGHLAGDYALKKFAGTLGSVIRPYDLLGRYGGEEFIIVSPNAAGSETTGMIERTMKTMRDKTLLFEGHEMRFTFSCGLAASSEFARDTLSLQAMLALADKRLYEAKQDGRDRCVGPVAQLHGRLP